MSDTKIIEGFAPFGEFEMISRRDDEATPATVQPFFANTPDVRWEIFEDSSHMPFIEESAKYREVVEAFLGAYD